MRADGRTGSGQPPGMRVLTRPLLTALEQLAGRKPLYLGCYMYDFANRRPLSVERMRRQTELGYRWLRKGRIRGMIFLATSNVDVDLEAVDWTRQWVATVRDTAL